MVNQRSFELALADAAFVAAYLKHLVEWDARASVRVQRRGNTIGVYGAPPLGCLSLIVVPTFVAQPLPEEPAIPEDTVRSEPGPPAFDLTVSAGRLRDVLGDVSGPARRGPFEQIKRMTMPDAVTGPTELILLPPDGPWDNTGQTTASDLVSLVEGGVTEFRRRAPDAAINPTHAQYTADDIWGTTAWAGLPLRALHAARLLGFLANPDAPVEAGTCYGWKRLVTPAGRVFTNTTTGLSTFSLTVI